MGTYYDKLEPNICGKIAKAIRYVTPVLDVGCGEGGLMNFLASKFGKRIFGVDVSDFSFEKGRADAELEPYLGFLHLLQHGKPSFVCDLQELYRHLVDDFLVQYCLRLRKSDFTTKVERVSRKRKGRRKYLNGSQTRHLMKQLNAFFETAVEVPRIRVGKKQTIETLINEEAFLLAKFLRNDKQTWIPRIAFL